LLIHVAALLLGDSFAHLLIDRLNTGLALLIIDGVADLHVDHLTLLLGDGLCHGLTLLLQFAVTALLIDNVTSLVDDSVALLLPGLTAHLINDIGALLGHALITDLLILDIDNGGTNILGDLTAGLLKCGCASFVHHLFTFSILHDMTDRMSDFGALLLCSGLTGLLIDNIHHISTLLTAAWLTALAVCHRAPSVLHSLTLFLLCDVADLVSNICTLDILDILAYLLISGLTGGGTWLAVTVRG